MKIRPKVGLLTSAISIAYSALSIVEQVSEKGRACSKKGGGAAAVMGRGILSGI